MRILVCPDKFAGTLAARAAAEAIAAGWASARPESRVSVRPLSDGGPGFLDALNAALGGRLVEVATTGPLDQPVRASVLVHEATAYVESAQACGLHLLAPAQRDPRVTTSYGLGALLRVAVAAGAEEIVVGLGGSASNDAGAGLLASLGAVPVDAAGRPLPRGGAALADCDRLDGRPADTPALLAATDVDNPLVGPSGATVVYGPQKGARPDDLADLDAALATFATVLQRDLPHCPVSLPDLPGAGAAGGLGAAILALGGQRVSGFALVRTLTELDAALDACDLVVTGEGSFDQQSLRGKVVAGVAGAAHERGLPCLVLAGRVGVDEQAYRSAGVTQAYGLVEELGSESAALNRPAEGLRALAARLAAEWPSARN